MEIPTSEKGYGAMYVPWVKVTKPSWFTGNQDHIDVSGPNRRKLQKSSKSELYVPPVGTWLELSLEWTLSGVFTKRRPMN